jgi:hypothetical protein
MVSHYLFLSGCRYFILELILISQTVNDRLCNKVLCTTRSVSIYALTLSAHFLNQTGTFTTARVSRNIGTNSGYSFLQLFQASSLHVINLFPGPLPQEKVTRCQFYNAGRPFMNLIFPSPLSWEILMQPSADIIYKMRGCSILQETKCCDVFKNKIPTTI